FSPLLRITVVEEIVRSEHNLDASREGRAHSIPEVTVRGLKRVAGIRDEDLELLPSLAEAHRTRPRASLKIPHRPSRLARVDAAMCVHQEKVDAVRSAAWIARFRRVPI